MKRTTMAISARLTILIMILLIFGCSEESVAPAADDAGEGELITTVELRLVESGLNQTTVYWRDLDGDGGSNPVIDTLILGSGFTYDGAVRLLNESETPTEDITAEVSEEDDNHQLFYDVQGDIAGQVTVTVTDSDSRGFPLGLDLQVTVDAGAAGSEGQLRVRLFHYDDAGDKDGTSFSDETDVDVVFPVRIQ